MPEKRKGVDEIGWIHTWVSAQQLVEPGNHPPEPGLSGATLRQRLLLTLGGEALRVTFSNEYGKSPLEIRAAAVALPGVEDEIRVGTGGKLLFEGKASTVVPPGSEVTSDALSQPFEEGRELALTVVLGEVPRDLTGHPGSRTTSFIGQGSEVGDERLLSLKTTDHWYFASGIEVKTDPDARAVVILGDSITDGRGSTTNGNDRYPNHLATRLRAREGQRPVAVLNQGIGGNRVLEGGLGPTVLERFRRDALSLPGVAWVVIFAGINDLGALFEGKGATGPSAEDLMVAYRTIAKEARAENKRIYAVTLLPYEGAFYFTEEGEAERQKLNTWIRETKDLDGFIDFDARARNPENPRRLRSVIDGGDHLHPSAAGYHILAESIDLGLFTEVESSCGCGEK